MSGNYYICRKENYGANGNFTRYTMLKEYKEPEPILIHSGNCTKYLDYYKNWCSVFCFLILALVFSTWYYHEKSTHCMSDQQIANYMRTP